MEFWTTPKTADAELCDRLKAVGFLAVPGTSPSGRAKSIQDPIHWGPPCEGVRAAITRSDRSSLVTAKNYELMVHFQNVGKESVYLTPAEVATYGWELSPGEQKIGLHCTASRHEGKIHLEPGQIASVKIRALPLSNLQNGRYSVTMCCRPMFDQTEARVSTLFTRTTVDQELITSSIDFQREGGSSSNLAYYSPQPVRPRIRRPSSAAFLPTHHSEDDRLIFPTDPS